MKTDTPSELLVPPATAPARALPLKPLLLLIVPGAAIMLPLVSQNFFVFQLTVAMIYAIAILGLNLLTGFNGQFSLGHGAFYAIGAYTAAIMMDQWEIAYYWTLPAAGLICLIVGFLFGLPALRLEGLYLALATFALALAMPQLLKYKHFEDWTGGVQGLVLLKPDAPSMPREMTITFVMGFLAFTLLFAANLLQIPIRQQRILQHFALRILFASQFDNRSLLQSSARQHTLSIYAQF